MRNRPDEELLRLFLQKRDPVFLGELFERHIHLVFGLCLKYLKDVHAAKDAVISIYEKIQTDIEKHDVKNFKSWLYVVSKNHCLMQLRKAKPGSFVEISDTVFMESETELHPIDRENNEETKRALEECIEKLKEIQKNSILFFYYENKCYREIAEILKTTENKVKSYIQNAKRNLKICLGSKK